MKKKGLKEATQLYHVSSSPVQDTLVETSASPTNSPIPTPTGFAHSALPLCLQDGANHNHFCIAAPFSEPPSQTSSVTPDRLEEVLGPLISSHASGGSSKWRDRTADWVEMVERSALAGLRRGGGDAGIVNSFHKNPNFRRTSSFNDTKPQPPPSAQSRQFRERSMTQVTYPASFVYLFIYCRSDLCRSLYALLNNKDHTLSFSGGISDPPGRKLLEQRRKGEAAIPFLPHSRA